MNIICSYYNLKLNGYPTLTPTLIQQYLNVKMPAGHLHKFIMVV